MFCILYAQPFSADMYFLFMVCSFVSFVLMRSVFFFLYAVLEICSDMFFCLFLVVFYSVCVCVCVCVCACAPSLAHACSCVIMLIWSESVKIFLQITKQEQVEMFGVESTDKFTCNQIVNHLPLPYI
jgi:hypothetical protein